MLDDLVGKDIPGIRWRKSDIYLRNDYCTSQHQPSQRFQHVDTLIPDSDRSISERRHANKQRHDEEIMQAMARMTDLPTALMLARQLARRHRHLGSALMLGHKNEPAPAERCQLQESRASSSEPTTESAVQVSAPSSQLCEAISPNI